MKIFNKLASALMVLPMLAALTACESDAEYTAPEALSNAQVYFANDLETSVALSGDETSFDVIVNRQNPKGELSVAIKAEQDENNLFTIPLAVTFADGEKEAKLTIAYDPTVMEFNDMHPISLSIADEETYSTPYGNVSYDFEAGIRPPFSAWATNANELAELTGSDVNILGTQTKEFTGTYLYTQFFSGADPELPVAFRMNKAFPEQVQFKVGKWGYGVDLIMDAVYDEECQLYRINVPTTFIGYVHPSYGKVYAVESITYAKENVESMDRDWMHDYIENYDGPNWQKYCSYYDPATGEFVLNLTYFVDLGYFGYGEEYLTMDGYVRKDYSAAVSYAGMLKTAEGEFQAVADLTLGRHIATAKYAVVDGTIEDIDAAIAIMSGEVESTTIEYFTDRFEKSQERVYCAMGDREEGKYKIVVVTFDEEGEAQEYAAAIFEFEKGGSSWESLGMRWYTDDFTTMGGYDEESGEWGAAFGINDPVTYPVEVLVNSKKPGLYRLKNAYGEANPRNEEGDWDTSMDYYLEIDATDPNYVMINKQELGCNWYDLGMMSVESDGSYYVNKYGMTPAEIVAAITEGGGEDPFGKLADGIITFPAADVFEISFGEYAFYGNHNSAFKVDLNEEAVEGGETKAARFVKRMRHYTKLANMSMRQKARKVVVAKRLNTKSARIIK